MMCDFIIAADTAKFGQPEITLGVMPGMGGSQRLTRFVGKSKAMDMCLTGRMMDAAEAERCGLVSRVVPPADLMEEAMKAAAKIADFSLPAVMMAKEAVNRAYETTLARGPALRAAAVPFACSRSTTRRKAWRPSPRSGRPNFQQPLKTVRKRAATALTRSRKLHYKPRQSRRPWAAR